MNIRIRLVLIIMIFGMVGAFAQTAEELYEKGKSFYVEKEYKKAEKALLKATKITPIVEGYLLLNLVYSNLKDVEKQIVNLNTGLHYFPKNSFLYNSRGILYQSFGETDLALRDYNLGIKFTDNDTIKCMLIVNRGTVKAGIRDFQGAYEDYMEVYKIDSLNISALNNMATVCDEIGRDDEVLGYLYKVLEIDSTMIGGYVNIGYRYQKIGEYEKSISFFDKALEIDPNDPFSYSNRSYSKLKIGDLKGALVDVNISIKIYPMNSYAFRNRGLIYLEMKKEKKACEDFNEAIRLGFTEMYGGEVSELLRKYCN